MLTLDNGIELVQQLHEVIFHLTQAASNALLAEELWAEHGSGVPVTLWTVEQKQAFQDIKDHTELLRDTLLSREVNL